jgi:ubiquinone/menaquinone biosynthesis C-methylase UbiE
MKPQDYALPFRVCSENASTTPRYLVNNYWWAYIHPLAVKIFERQWVVNLILFGNFRRLKQSILDCLHHDSTESTLQIACVYGDFTEEIAANLPDGAQLDVVDVLPIQLHNLKNKLNDTKQINLYQCNSAQLEFADDATYNQAIIFFLLHEQPEETKRATMHEAYRVVKPGGKIIVVDYHRPRAWNPFRYLIHPILHWLEPYALQLWNREIEDMLPTDASTAEIEKKTLFGGLYQRVVIRR